MFLSLIALGSAYVVTLRRLSSAESELAVLRKETGYLGPFDSDSVAAVRLASEQPMTYRFRVRVPEGAAYRLVYSSMWQSDASEPAWYAAIRVPAGESIVIVRILRDMRDDRWKIAALRRIGTSTQRLATALPNDQVDVFRGSHDHIQAGITDDPVSVEVGEAIRLLDERILIGEGAMLLYGDRPPRQDMIGVYAELQPDVGAI